MPDFSQKQAIASKYRAKLDGHLRQDLDRVFDMQNTLP